MDTITTNNILLRADSDGVATLTLNRPAARNALSTGLMAALQTELDAIATDGAIRVVVIAANGPAFCAGHDLREVRGTPTREAYEALFAQCSALMLSIMRLPQPVIARVHATATAAGCQLVATCDLAVAVESARFATPGVNIGLFCSTPMVAVSRNLGRKQVMDMLLTGDMIDAKAAIAGGLINKAVPDAPLDAALDEAVDVYCRQIISKSSLTLKIGKEAFYRQLEMPLEDAYAYASEVMVTNMLARDAEEGIDAFLEKRDPEWTGE
jgi:enoyl-CoA hydratase/carnithine racemase